MSASFFSQSPLSLLVLGLAFPVGGVACKGTTSASGSAGSETATCPSPPAADDDGGVAPYEGFASGTASGSGLSASLCNAEVLVSDFNGSSSGLLFSVDSTAAFASTDVKLPAGALQGTLTASIAIATPAPGVYASSDAIGCGSLIFSYGTLDAGAAKSCDVGPDGVCPAGCTSTFFCADAAAAPCCVPLATTYVYQAAAAPADAASGCNSGVGTQTALGAWTLTLTSVTAYPDDASAEYGQNFYLAHGTLTATLQGTTDTTATASVSLTF